MDDLEELLIRHRISLEPNGSRGAFILGGAATMDGWIARHCLRIGESFYGDTPMEAARKCIESLQGEQKCA